MEWLALLLLAVMIRSDFKERVIHLYPLFFFGVLTVVGSGLAYGWRECATRLVGCCGLLLFLAGGVMIYLIVKYRRGVNPLRGYMGTGDVLFLFCLTSVFQVIAFTWFLIISFTLTLIAWRVFMYKDDRSGSIPLVSTVGLCYGGYMMYELICHLI